MGWRLMAETWAGCYLGIMGWLLSWASLKAEYTQYIFLIIGRFGWFSTSHGNRPTLIWNQLTSVRSVSVGRIGFSVFSAHPIRFCISVDKNLSPILEYDGRWFWNCDFPIWISLILMGRWLLSLSRIVNAFSLKKKWHKQTS